MLAASGQGGGVVERVNVRPCGQLLKTAGTAGALVAMAAEMLAALGHGVGMPESSPRTGPSGVSTGLVRWRP